MISRALDENNDIFVKNGRIAIVSGESQVIQHVRTRLLFYLNEWFLDQSAGTPYYQEIFVKPYNLNNIESIIKLRIAKTPELNSITSFSMNYVSPDTRLLSISFTANTDYGNIDSGEVTLNV